MITTAATKVAASASDISHMERSHAVLQLGTMFRRRSRFYGIFL
jgi:hypothetical protein